MSNAKQQVESLLQKLPDNCSLEDIQYRLYVLDKVRRGMDDARKQGRFRRKTQRSGGANGSASSLVAARHRGR